MTIAEIPREPVKARDAAGRQYVVVIKRTDKEATFRANVLGNGIKKEVSLDATPPINWTLFAQKAISQALKETYGIEPTRQ